VNYHISLYGDIQEIFPSIFMKKSVPSAKSLSDSALELIAARFRALSEPMRLRLLNLLMQGEQSVGQLVEATGSSQANVSKHLSLLREAGMLGVRKEGLTSIYFIADPMVNDLCEMMCYRLRVEMEDKAKSLAPGLS
jgi:DNA-binding transcriptional ArsR family regulator